MIVKYINSKGVEVNLNKPPYRMLVSDLLDYEWDVVESAETISGFQKSISQRSINIDIWKTKEKSSRILMNELTNIFETDIATGVPGKLYIDDNYLVCYIHKSEKSNWETKLMTSCEYGLVTDKPFWITEITKPFSKGAGSASDALDYPHDYPYDHAPKVAIGSLTNDNYAAADFRLTIYGPVINPAVTIGENIYQVITEVKDGEYLVIDSQEQYVEQYDLKGNATNKFNSRVKQYQIYAQIPPGTHSIHWPGNFGLDITMYQKRSEPRWNS